MKKIIYIMLFLFLLICLPAYAATPLVDTFTETSNTALESHDPDTGDTSSWDATGTGCSVNGTDDKLHNDGSGGVGTGAFEYCKNTTDIGSEDMTVSADLDSGSTSCCRAVGFLARQDCSGTSGDNAYFVYLGWPNANQTAYLIRRSTGSGNSTLDSDNWGSTTGSFVARFSDGSQEVDIDATANFLSGVDTVHDASSYQCTGVMVANRGENDLDNLSVEDTAGAADGGGGNIIIEGIKMEGIKWSRALESIFVKDAEAQRVEECKNCIVKYYESDICGDGSDPDGETGEVHWIQPCFLYELRPGIDFFDWSNYDLEGAKHIIRIYDTELVHQQMSSRSDLTEITRENWPQRLREKFPDERYEPALKGERKTVKRIQRGR